MAKMVLDAYTFAVNPIRMTLVEPVKAASGIKTYSSAVYFSWDPTIEGKKLTLEWKYMSNAQYVELDTLCQADAAVVFDPKKDDAKTYNVQIESLDSRYYAALDGTGGHRRDVKMSLFVLSEV